MTTDKVFKKNGAWYFWDETGTVEHGPYTSRVIAKKEKRKYQKWMGIENIGDDI